MKEEITLDTTVTAKELAIVLGLSVRRIQQLVQDGIIEAVTRGKYNLAKSVERYLEIVAKRSGDTKKEITEEELKIKRSKAIIASLEAKEVQGKMHRSEDVADMTEDLIYTIRGMLLSLPGRLAVDVANISDTAEAAEVVKKEVHFIMEEISKYKYDPIAYENKVRERQKWEIEEEAEKDSE